MLFAPTKLYYKIREVAQIVGVETHVLRYWEKEFPSLTPPKSRSGQRTYRPKDIELLIQIRTLLYEEGFTIAGARKHLGLAKHDESVSASPEHRPTSRRPDKPSGQALPTSKLSEVREELENILTLLNNE